MKYQNRADAGLHLAAWLRSYIRDANAIVLTLPRGGVPVGYEVARALHLPLDVFLVRSSTSYARGPRKCGNFPDVREIIRARELR